jgi:DNA-binding transcriptional MerR regulator
VVSEPELLSIGRFARLTGLSIGALRHYDELGLLTPTQVSLETGYRFYQRDQAAMAQLIARLRDFEMPLPEIRAVLAADQPERVRRLAAHRSRMEARTFRLQRILHQLSQEDPMSTGTSKPDVLDTDTHRQMGAHLFNHVWALLDTEDRSAQQDDEMLHAAHASRWHWAQSGVPDLRQRLAVGEWQCSRVYSVLGRAEPALFHAGRCRQLAEGEGIEDWVLASAYEATARASRVAGDRKAFEEWRERARRAVAAIADAEDREVIENDLATLGD